MNPTLWRTCRVLSGKTRIELLRRIVQRPGLSVSDLAGLARIGLPRASQELRRLQSRGLAKAVRDGPVVRYHPVPDPQVPSAEPLLMALFIAFRDAGNRADKDIPRIAKAFSQPRRIVMARILARGSIDLPALSRLAHIPRAALFRHLDVLRRLGFVAKNDRKQLVWISVPHPLARRLEQLMCQVPVSS
mgnify:CR=1 FL=1